MRFAALSLIAGLALAPGAGATPLWEEQPVRADAGKTLATAQVTTGTGSLDTISGTLGDDGSDNVDLFKIKAAGSEITAEAEAGGAFIRLFLFDADGFGVIGTTFDSLVSLTASVTDGAFYYLGIAMDPFQPLDASSNPIFNDDGSLTGTAGALDQWTDGAVFDPPFNISLFDISPAEDTPQVPGPATLVLVGVGLLGLGVIKRRQR